MDQISEIVVLEYKLSRGQDTDPYWVGKIRGQEKKFVRVIAGLAAPQLNRQAVTS